MSRLRGLIFILLAALAGAAAGRAFAEARRRAEVGEDPTALDFASLRPRPQDLVPGIVAGFRVRETPWSWLGIPGWLAAFGVNFGASALAGDLQRIREMFQDELPGFGDAPPPAQPYVTPVNGDSVPVWTAPDAPRDRPDPEPRTGATGFTPFRD
ncbi:MAG TPA: hypothetical protein VFG74_05695 [Miltoncostaeaceae bacterium]|nr:hypothetical protein [Miltoncostaeaceae bacterium]